MKVLLINGSPHAGGCTRTALNEVAGVLNECGVETQVKNVGASVRSGCLACGRCKRTGLCAVDDVVNEVIELLPGADGLVVGSPVYYSGANGGLCAFMDRLFYAASNRLAFKPAAAVCSARRAGTTATLERLNQYFLINNMPVVPSQYWNMVHGNSPEQVRHDADGLQTMRTLGRNMAWMLRCIAAGQEAGVDRPLHEPGVRTNFIGD